MDYLIFILVIVLIFILPVSLYFFVWCGLIDWRKRFGKEFMTLEINNIDISIRRKDTNQPFISNYDIHTVGVFIEEFFRNYNEYYDKNLWKSIQITLTENLYGGLNDSVKAKGTAGLTKAYFWYLKMRYMSPIFIDLETINLLGFSNRQLASLIVHEYMHYWFFKHNGRNCDHEHYNAIWSIVDNSLKAYNKRK